MVPRHSNSREQLLRHLIIFIARQSAAAGTFLCPGLTYVLIHSFFKKLFMLAGCRRNRLTEFYWKPERFPLWLLILFAIKIKMSAVASLNERTCTLLPGSLTKYIKYLTPCSHWIGQSVLCQRTYPFLFVTLGLQIVESDIVISEKLKRDFWFFTYTPGGLNHHFIWRVPENFDVVLLWVRTNE